MIIDNETNSIWFRQSWLDTAFRCPERGRQAIVKPEWDEMTSDSALIGTAVHHGIEQFLHGNIASPTGIAGEAESFLDTFTDDIKWTKYDTQSDLKRQADVCAQGWVNDILPNLPNLDEARPEVTFKIPLWSQHGYTIGITGTIDLIADGQLWDWKTSARAYNARDKQKYAIQPTIYAMAALNSDLVSADSFPMDFTYGIMIRGSKPKGQILKVTRHIGHADFATKRMMQLVDLFQFYGLDKTWPMNDEHFLCSATWCPWYSICRGAHISIADDRVSE